MSTDEHPHHTQDPIPEPRQISNVAVGAFILSIPSLCLFPFALISLPMGIVGISRYGPTASKGGRGLAIAATSISGVGLLLSCVQVAIILPLFALPKVAGVYEARRIEDQTRIERVVTDLHTFAENNNGRLPGPDEDWRAMLIREGTPATAFSSLVETAPRPFLHYVPATELTQVDGRVLLYTDPGLYYPGSGYIAYHDGFVEFVRAPRFARIINALTLPDGTPFAPHLDD